MICGHLPHTKVPSGPYRSYGWGSCELPPSADPLAATSAEKLVVAGAVISSMAVMTMSL